MGRRRKKENKREGKVDSIEIELWQQVGGKWAGTARLALNPDDSSQLVSGRLRL